MESEIASEQPGLTAMRRFRIGAAIVSERDRTVTIEGNAQALTDLSWRFLIALIDAAPDAVSYADLALQVWQRSHVTDETIAQRVRQVRSVLGDNPKQPIYIRTLRGGGYQLMPAVEQIPDIQTNDDRTVTRFTARFVTVALLLGVTVIGGYWLTKSDPSQHFDIPEVTPEVAELVRRAQEYGARSQRAANEYAITLYEDALALDPQNSAALVGLSYSLSHKPSKYEESGEWADRAAELADKALLADPENSDAWAARGLADDARGRVSNAIKYYQRASELDPGNQSLASNVAYLLQVQGKLHQSLQLEAQALANGPPTYFADYQIAITLDLAGLADASLSWLNRAAKLRPDNVFLVEYQARAEIRDSNYAAALLILDESESNRMGSHSLRGIIRLLEGDADAALQAFTEGQSIAENKGNDCYSCLAALSARGETSYEQRMHSLLNDATSAIRDGEEWPEFRVELAYLQVALRDEAAALQMLRQAFELGFLDWRWLEVSPLLGNLHIHPEFRTLIARMQQHAADERRMIESDPSLAKILAN